MSSSRPWSKHHAGPLLGGILLIFFYNFFWNNSLQSRCKYFTNDPRHSVRPESDVGDYHTHSAPCFVKLKTLGTETITFHVWSTWKHTWCTQEPLAASEMGGWVLYGCSLRWWVVMGVYLSCQGGSCGNSCIGCGAVGMKYVNKWIWAFFFTKRPIFFLY